MIKLLLDTHVLYWLLVADERLSEEAKELLLSNDTKIFYSIATLWEIAIKRNKYPDEYNFSEKQFEKYFKEAGYIELPIKAEHIFNLERLHFDNDKLKHSDPFDRIMISQAMTENMTFVTHDKTLSYYTADIRII